MWTWWLLGAAILCWLPRVFALDAKAYGVDVACEVQLAPPALILSWPNPGYARQYVVRRRTNLDSAWGDPIAILPMDSTGYVDTAVSAGIRYEYEIQMETTALGYEGTFIPAYSYLSAGMNAPSVDSNGKVLLLVDSSISSKIAAALVGFEQDLVGDGWVVQEREVDRNSTPSQIKDLVRAEYNSDTGNLQSIILIGHVPVPYSGNTAPDFHDSHKGAWPADVYYADMTGAWTDETVSVSSQDSPANDNFPGDGKFDQSEIPAPIVLEIGRIDFANLPSFAPRTETDLLNTYFRKNHDFRHRLVTAPRRGLMHDNFGDLSGDAPAVDAWRHFSGFFGHGTLNEIGPDEFMPTLNRESYLVAYGCGGGSFTKADGIGSTTDFAAGDPQAVFLMLHGSYFGDWNTTDNFLRAAIASPHMSLASVWTGIPHWYMHHVALGATFGYSARVTQNNRQTYKSYRNFFPGGVHISLLGDPTLRLFPVIPPGALTVSADNQIALNWAPSSDEKIVGYKIYHSGNSSGPFESLAAAPVAGTTFTHAAGAGTHYYMVRAVKLEKTGSGTFYNLSQGVFASIVTASGPINEAPVISSIPDQTVSAGSSTGKIPFKVSDRDTPSTELMVSVESSNPALFPNSAILLNGLREDRTVELTPSAGQTGLAIITLTVTDGNSSASTKFQANVNSVPEHRVTAIRVESNTVNLTIAGPPSSSFTLLSSTNGKNWQQATNGILDESGSAVARDPELASKFKLYQISWP